MITVSNYQFLYELIIFVRFGTLLGPWLNADWYTYNRMIDECSLHECYSCTKLTSPEQVKCWLLDTRNWHRSKTVLCLHCTILSILMLRVWPSSAQCLWNFAMHNYKFEFYTHIGKKCTKSLLPCPNSLLLLGDGTFRWYKYDKVQI